MRPLVSVCLPLYRMGSIAWLALEGLCGQVGASPWELIVGEEAEDSLGRDGLREYGDRLAAAGCVRVEHWAVSEWLPLGAKWLGLFGMMARSSRVAVLQAGDCLPHPGRLSETLDAVEAGASWVQWRSGAFLDLVGWRLARFSSRAEGYSHTCGLHMAVASSVARAVADRGPAGAPARGVDRWLFGSAVTVSREFTVHWREGSRGSIDTHGRNRISGDARRRAIAGPVAPFEAASWDDLDLPADVVARLRKEHAALTP